MKLEEIGTDIKLKGRNRIHEDAMKIIVELQGPSWYNCKLKDETATRVKSEGRNS